MPFELHRLLEQGSVTRAEGLDHITGSFPIDSAVIEVLPSEFTLQRAEPLAKSDWSITGCLSGVAADNVQTKYFVKCASGDDGKMMLEGEYASLQAIQAVCPDLVPHVLGWGAFKQQPIDDDGIISIYFLVAEFLELEQTPPDVEEFTARIATMHLTGHSSDGKFGFPIPTCDGPLPHPVSWRSSWTDFFAELLRSRVHMDAEACGPWPELDRAASQVLTHVVPRLLNGLTWQGQPIRPSLIHGDLWDTNVGTITLPPGEDRRRRRRTIIYDPGAYYAHNEMELGIWRVIHAKNLGREVYRSAYLRAYPPADPASEWDDRNRLYSLKCNLNWSATDPGDDITRRIAYNDMLYLCEKYAPSDGNPVDKYDPAIDPMVTAQMQT